MKSSQIDLACLAVPALLFQSCQEPKESGFTEDFNAAEKFYTYGLECYPDRLVWWIINPADNSKVTLWDYQESTPVFSGIPDNRTRYRMNFWHTNNWAVESNPNSLEKPAYPFELEIDWMAYEPFNL